jgi:hypothetical protein
VVWGIKTPTTMEDGDADKAVFFGQGDLDAMPHKCKVKLSTFQSVHYIIEA